MPDRSRYRLADVADLEDLIEHAERARRLLLSIRGTSTLTALGLAVVDLEYVGRALVRIAGRRSIFGEAPLSPSDDDPAVGPASVDPVGGSGSLVREEKKR